MQTRKVYAIMFDLGGTLIGYYERRQFPRVLDSCIDSAVAYLVDKGIPVDRRELAERINLENHESEDLSVRPLEGRLRRIFGTYAAGLSGLELSEMVRRFMQPIFSMARLYADVIPTLVEARRRGYKLSIVSNTPWGSPADLWREELGRFGLTKLVDDAIFCVDVGFRKPAPLIFELAAQRLGVDPISTAFVGDDPRWDFEGPRRCGMTPIIVKRPGTVDHGDAPEAPQMFSHVISTLSDVFSVINRIDGGELS